MKKKQVFSITIIIIFTILLLKTDNMPKKEKTTTTKTIEVQDVVYTSPNINETEINIKENTSYIKKVNSSYQEKEGWITVDDKTYYYKNGRKVKDAYVDYVYLNSYGVAKEKVGDFSATLYGARAWANQNLNMREHARMNSNIVGTVPVGEKMYIISSDNPNTKYIKVKYNNKIGYVYSDYIYINLPDIIPDIVYRITNANSSIFKSAGYEIEGITGRNLYGFTKKYNKKIGKRTYFAPILYPVAKQVQTAYNIAKSEGYNLKIYDTYRPYDISQEVNAKFQQLYYSNSNVKNIINYDREGSYWGPSWFLAQSVSKHNRGIALDVTITDFDDNELSAQTRMHTLDTRSLRKYNNNVANKLSSIMTRAGFETLESEWWHFQEDDYKNSKYTSFKIK